MTIESFLTRELNVRFIDARNLATEAKLNLGYHDYPSKSQKLEIQEEACRIFSERLSDSERSHLREQSNELKNTKNLMLFHGSGNISKSGSNTSLHSASNYSSSSSQSSRSKNQPFWLPGAARR